VPYRNVPVFLRPIPADTDMKLRRWAKISVISLLALFVVAAGAAVSQLPSLAAGGLLHPWRRPVNQPPPSGCEDKTYPGKGVALAGWQCHASGERRGTLVYLHGVADNRAAVAGIVSRFTAQGFDVVAYDSRAHGNSQGDTCTYGFYEKEDLRSVLDTLDPGPIVLIGTSLGAAVALQEAADDSRVTAVVSAEVFSDLRTVARERAPFFLTEEVIRKAFSLAEARGQFVLDQVSPVEAARRIPVPVLLIHGASDKDTVPDHSRRVYAALQGPKQLILVEGAGHNESLNRGDVWNQIDRWISGVVKHVPPR
jgi:pimeloyl-ACP methyl ester carboxylesterase